MATIAIYVRDSEEETREMLLEKTGKNKKKRFYIVNETLKGGTVVLFSEIKNKKRKGNWHAKNSSKFYKEFTQIN